MDENETRVLYSAIADFTQVIAKAAEAKAALAALRDEEKKYNDASVSGAAQNATAKEKTVTAANKVKQSLKDSADAAAKETAAFEKEAVALGKSATAHDKAAKSAKGHASATKEVEEAGSKAANFFRLMGGFLNSYSLGMDKTSSSNKKFAKELENNADQAERTSRVLNVLERSFNLLGSTVGKVGNINGRALFIGALIPIITSLLALINPLVAGLGALGGAALGLAGNLGSLVGAALAVGPALSAMGAAIAGIKIAFGGIGGVFQAFSAAQKASGGGGGGGGGTPQQAQLTHLEQVQRAQEKYRRSIQDVTFAEDNLTQARRSAQRQLRTLTEEVERAQIATDRSNASLQLARENYANILADPSSTKGQKEDARISVEEAQNNVSDTKDQNQYNAEDLATAQKQGIDGNQQVVMAQRGVTDAIWAVRDAQLALINAQNGTATASSGAAKAADLYQQALNKLSPSAKAVVLALIGMKDQWDKLHLAVQEAFFSKVLDGVRNLVVLFPVMTKLLAGAAGAAGDVAANFLKMVESPAWIKDFGTLAERNTPLIHSMGGVLLDVLNIIRNLTLAAGPFAQKVADALQRVFDNLDKVVGIARDDGSLAKWLDTIYNRLSVWWDIVKNISMTVFNYASAASGLGDKLVGSLDQITKGWLASSEEAKKAGSPFRKWLDDIQPVLTEFKKVLGAFFDWFGKTAADPKNIQQMTDILDLIVTKVGPGLATALKAMSDSGVGKSLVDTVGSLVQAIGEVMKNGGADGLKMFMGLFEGLANLVKLIASIPGGGFLLVSVFSAIGGLKILSLLGNFSGITSFFTLLLRVAGTSGVFSLLDKIPLLGKLGVGSALQDVSNSAAAQKASDAAVLRTRRAGGSLAAQEAAGEKASQQVYFNRSPAGRKANANSKAETKIAKSAKKFGPKGPSKLARFGKGAGIAALIGGGLFAADQIFNSDSASAEEMPGGAPTSAGKKPAGKYDISKNDWSGLGAATLGGAATGAMYGGIPGAVIGAAASAISAALVMKADNGKTVGQNLTPGSDAWKHGAKQIGDFFAGIGKAFSNGAKQLNDFFAMVGKPFANGAKQITTWFTNLGKGWDKFVLQIAVWWGNLTKKWNDFVTQIGIWWAKLGKKWDDFILQIGVWWAKIGKKWDDFVIQIGIWWARLGKAWDNGVAQIGSFFASVGRAFQHGADQIGSFFGGIGTAFANGAKQIGDFFGGVGRAFSNGAKQIGDFFGGFGTTIAKGFKGLINGAIDFLHLPVAHLNSGGTVPGSGDGDTVPAMLTPGEFVLRKGVAAKIGQDKLNKLNQGVFSIAQLFQGGNDTGVAGLSSPSFMSGSGLVPSLPNSAAGSNLDLASLQQSGQTVNNSGTTVQELHVHNPVPEPASESLPKSIRKLAYLQNR